MAMHSPLIRWLSCLLLSIALSTPVAAQDLGDHLVIGYPSIQAVNAPLWVAQDLGFFRKHGLKTEIVFILGGVRIIQGVVAGALQVAWGGGPATLNAILSGADLKVIAALNEMIPYKLVVAKNITRAEQLRGKRVAISRVGDTSDFGASMALKRLGINIDREMTRVPAGTDVDRLVLVERGGAEAAIVEMVTGLMAEKRGYRVLADLTTGPERMLGSGIVVKTDMINKSPDICRALLKAIVESIHFLKTHPVESEKLLARRMRVEDQEQLELSYSLQAQKRILTKPIPTNEGIQTALEFVSLTNPKAKTAKPEQFVDLRFIHELERNGYIDSLWSNSAEGR
ncbi:MAG TPA: ABC transporter substrate-binding protein [Methylomirabilota bacterium]|jgi:NitT/TauT family transport system substrate-binding protein|nr:ABC transporter substrate-binding protein [Methylomirabilota bacterium]